MENIATPIPPKSASVGNIAKRHGGVTSLDKVLFDAFVSTGGIVPEGKQAPADAPEKAAAKTALKEAQKDAPVSKKVLPEQHDKAPAPVKHAVKQKEEKEPGHACLEEAAEAGQEAVLADEQNLVVHKEKSASVVEAALSKAIENPETLAKLKKLLNLGDDVSAEDVLKICMDNMREILNFAKVLRDGGLLVKVDGQPAAKDEPVDVVDAIMQSIAALMAAQQQKLTETERKLRDGLLELSTIGGGAAQDDAVDAAVSNNLDALDDWKAAMAEAQKDSDKIILPQAQKPANKAQNASDAPHPLDVRSAQNLATGGRPDASLVNNQASPSQTLPLLPTQLTGGQQRLPVANQNVLGSNNLDAIARPVSALGAADAAGKLARAAVRGQINLPQVYEQVSVRLNRMAKAGDKSMTVQLNPAELGRVEVKLDFARDGHVTARIAADNQQTLDLLQRDSKALERALADAGLNVDNNSLQFSLRQGGDGQAQRFADNLENRRFWQENRSDAPLVADEILINVSPALAANGRVDIQV